MALPKETLNALRGGQLEAAKPKEAGGLVPSFRKGLALGTSGRAINADVPEVEPSGWGEQLAETVGEVTSDIPFFIAGSKIGAPVGGALGAAVGGPVGAGIGGALAGGATAFAFNRAMKEAFIIRNEHPDRSMADIAEEVAAKWPDVGKEAILGALTSGVGLASRVGTGLLTKSASEGVQKAAQVGSEVASQTAAFGTASPLLMEGRTPNTQDYVDAAALITLLTGAHIGVRKLRDAFRQRPAPMNKLLEDLKNIEKLRAEGKLTEAGAVLEGVQETMKKALAAEGRSPEDAARIKEGVRQGVEAANRLKAKKEAELTKAQQELEERGHIVTKKPSKKAKEAAPEATVVEKEKEAQAPPVVEKKDLPPKSDLVVTPDAAMLLPEGHPVRLDWVKENARYEELTKSFGYENPEVRQAARRMESLDQAADILLRLEGRIRAMEEGLKRTDIEAKDRATVEKGLEEWKKLRDSFQLIASWTPENVPWRMEVKEFDREFLPDATSTRQFSEALGKTVQIELGTKDLAEAYEIFRERTGSPLLREVPLVAEKTIQGTVDRLQQVLGLSQVEVAQAGITEKVTSSRSAGFAVRLPTGKMAIVVKQWLLKGSEPLGALRHEVQHILDYEQGYTYSRPVHVMGPANEAYTAGQIKAGELIRIINQGHFKGDQVIEIDGTRRWIIEKALEVGIEVPDKIVKDAGVDPLQLARRREEVIDTARKQRQLEQALQERERIQRKVMEAEARGDEVVRSPDGTPLFIRKKEGWVPKETGAREKTPRPEAPTEEAAALPKKGKPGRKRGPSALDKRLEMQRRQDEEGGIEVLESRVDILHPDKDIPDKLKVANTEAALAAETRAAKRWYDRFTVESIGRRIADIEGLPGAPEVFTRIKLAPSIWTLIQRQAVDMIRRTSKMAKGSTEDMIRAYIAAETPKVLESMTPGDRARIEPIVREYQKYFEDGRKMYAEHGVDLDYVKRRISDATRDMLTAKTIEQVEAARRRLEALTETNYVHLPYRLLWRVAQGATPAQRIALKLLHAKKRYTLTLADLFNARDKQGNPIFKPEDFSVQEAFGSYAVRLGRDMAFLNVVEAAKKAGLVVPENQKGVPRYYQYPADYMVLLHGKRNKNGKLVKNKVHPVLKEWAEMLTKPATHSALDQALQMGKSFAFINPLFLPGYDLFQGAMYGAILNVKMPKYMAKAIKSAFTHDAHYAQAARDGLFSVTGHEPWASYKNMLDRAAQGGIKGVIGSYIKAGLTPNVLKLAKTTLMSVYEASWNTAWMLDGVVRLNSYFYGLENGLTSRQAAQMAARFHGDYASVPPATRRTLNKVFFTPTFKIVMGKLWGDMLKGTAKTLTGRGTSTDKLMAAALTRTAVILIGFDMVMRSVGFERDRWGLAYAKKYFDEDEGREKEAVMTWPTPVNLPLKYMYRAWAASRGDKLNPPLTLLNSMQWEIHPIWRSAMNIAINRDDRGQPIRRPFDSSVRQTTAALVYGMTSVVRALGALDTQPTDEKASKKVREELGNLFWITGGFEAFGKQFDPFTYNYIRGDIKSRKGYAINRLKKEFEDQAFSYMREMREQGKEPDQERIRAWAEDFQRRIESIENWK